MSKRERKVFLRGIATGLTILFSCAIIASMDEIIRRLA